MEMRLPQPFFFEHSRRAVILFHAYSGSANDVRMLGRQLEEQNYTVYAPQFAGHATMYPENILTATPDLWWQDVAKAIAFLKNKGYEEIAVFGLSLGGIFAYRALEMYPELLGGGSFCSPIFPSDKTNLVPAFLGYSEKIIGYREKDLLKTQEELQIIREKLPKQLQAINTFSETVAADIKKVRQPAFIAQAGQDELIDANTAYTLRDALAPQTAVSFHWYPDSQHVITVDRTAHKQLEQDVIAFLETLPWRNEDN